MFIKSILKKYLEHQTLGRRFICPIVQATQCNILQIDGFLFTNHCRRQNFHPSLLLHVDNCVESIYMKQNTGMKVLPSATMGEQYFTAAECQVLYKILKLILDQNKLIGVVDAFSNVHCRTHLCCCPVVTITNCF